MLGGVVVLLLCLQVFLCDFFVVCVEVFCLVFVCVVVVVFFYSALQEVLSRASMVFSFLCYKFV